LAAGVSVCRGEGGEEERKAKFVLRLDASSDASNPGECFFLLLVLPVVSALVLGQKSSERRLGWVGLVGWLVGWLDAEDVETCWWWVRKGSRSSCCSSSSTSRLSSKIELFRDVF
jgi:hypothetical protein